MIDGDEFGARLSSNFKLFAARFKFAGADGRFVAVNAAAAAVHMPNVWPGPGHCTVTGTQCHRDATTATASGRGRRALNGRQVRLPVPGQRQRQRP